MRKPSSRPSPHTQHRPGIRGLASRLRRGREAGRPGRPGNWAALVPLGLLGMLLAAVLLICIWPALRADLQAVAVLDLVANQPLPGPLHAWITEPITVTQLTIPAHGGPIRARLYAPAGHPDAPTLVVLHGVHYLGINEPRLIAFASALASCGLRVLTPELPDIKDYHVGSNSIATIGDAAVWMAKRNGGRPVGVMGLSFSGGLALLAAADPVYRPSIKFVVAIGSQDEMSRVAEYYRTGEDERPNGTEEDLPPHEYGALVLEYEHLEDFIPSRDLAPVRAVLRAHLYEDEPAEKAALARLSPQQLGEATQLMKTNSAATRDALARAEVKHIVDMAGVSPHGHLANLTTPVYLLHGEGDNIIPSAETMWMENELPSETLKAALISPVLSHLDLDGAGPSLLDHLRLVHFFALILRAAEAR